VFTIIKCRGARTRYTIGTGVDMLVIIKIHVRQEHTSPVCSCLWLPMHECDPRLMVKYDLIAAGCRQVDLNKDERCCLLN
jgi:hypothetical protein